MVLQAIHGVRIITSVKNLVPAGADIDCETATLIAEEREQLEGIYAIPGSVELLAVSYTHLTLPTICSV